MITSNLITKEVTNTGKDCPICGNYDRNFVWKSFFTYCDNDSKKELTDFNNESYYLCNECGYFQRERRSGKSGIFSDYNVKGISIFESDGSEYDPDLRSQILNLSRNRSTTVGLSIKDHLEYEPDFYEALFSE